MPKGGSHVRVLAAAGAEVGSSGPGGCREPAGCGRSHLPVQVVSLDLVDVEVLGQQGPGPESGANKRGQPRPLTRRQAAAGSSSSSSSSSSSAVGALPPPQPVPLPSGPPPRPQPPSQPVTGGPAAMSDPGAYYSRPTLQAGEVLRLAYLLPTMCGLPVATTGLVCDIAACLPSSWHAPLHVHGMCAHQAVAWHACSYAPSPCIHAPSPCSHHCCGQRAGGSGVGCIVCLLLLLLIMVGGMLFGASGLLLLLWEVWGFIPECL